jgi:hypothetical protein
MRDRTTAEGGQGQTLPLKARERVTLFTIAIALTTLLPKTSDRFYTQQKSSKLRTPNSLIPQFHFTVRFNLRNPLPCIVSAICG